MSSSGRRPAFSASLALVGATGCDIVQGLGDAGKAIFPDRPTYLNTPGTRLAAGSYSTLDFSGVWLGHHTIGFKLLARSVDPGDDSLAVIGFTDGRVCKVEHVGAYRSSSLAGAGEVMLSYLDGAGPRGTLRFADPECQPLPAVVPDAALSSAVMADGRRLVVSGEDLVLVDAAAGVIEPFEPAVERIMTRANGPFLIQAGGHLSVYDDDWNLLHRHGKGVVRSGYVAYSSRIVFEDENGISVASPAGAAALIARGACGLGFSSWQPLFVTYRQPCDGGPTVALQPDSLESVELGRGVNPEHAEFWRSGIAPNQALWVAHYRDFDDDTEVGTLLLRSEDGRDLVLGARAAPEWLNPSAGGTEGFTLVDVDGEVGDLVRFDTSGAVRVVVERALRHQVGVGLIANFDGIAGDLGGLDFEGRFRTMLERVPRTMHAYVNHDATVGAAFAGFDGRAGTLSRVTSTYEERVTVATRVLHPHHGFIDSLFPGMAWIRADEDGGDTGTLEYQNTDLVYTATVSEGVASFLPTTEGLIYAVPRGAGAGVWFAEGK
jgi:hypothetical protein